MATPPTIPKQTIEKEKEKKELDFSKSLWKTLTVDSIGALQFDAYLLSLLDDTLQASSVVENNQRSSLLFVKHWRMQKYS